MPREYPPSPVEPHILVVADDRRVWDLAVEHANMCGSIPNPDEDTVDLVFTSEKLAKGFASKLQSRGWTPTYIPPRGLKLSRVMIVRIATPDFVGRII